MKLTHSLIKKIAAALDADLNEFTPVGHIDHIDGFEDTIYKVVRAEVERTGEKIT